MKSVNTNYLKILALASLSVFAGYLLILMRNRGYFFPLFTNDYLMGGMVQSTTGIPYEQYATGTAAASVVSIVRYTCMTAMSVSGIICLGVLAGVALPFSRFCKVILFAGAIAVALIQSVQVIDNRNYLLIAEYAIIFLTPFLLWWLFANEGAILNIGLIQLAILLTFCSHGLFAIGFPFKTPAPFIDMIIHTTGVKENTARQMLMLAGVMDFVVSISLFFTPTGSRLKQTCLAYLAAWGLLTALGRISGNYYGDLGWYNVRQFVPETLYRLPHFLIPLLLFIINRKRSRAKTNQAKVVQLKPVTAL